MRAVYFFQTERLGIRMLSEDDIEWYSEWFNDKEVCKFNSHHRYTYSTESIKEYVQQLTDNQTMLVFALIELKTGIHIGNISLQEINYVDRNAELAFLIGEKDYWGKGYAQEAALEIIHHAFFELNLHRLYLGTADNNVGMQKLAKKLGFTEEGRRKDALYKTGAYHDLIEYGLIKS